MEILLVLEYYPPHLGGIEIVFKNLAEGLVERGHDVKVVTSRTGNTNKQETLNGVRLYRSPVIDKMDRYVFTATGIPKSIKHARDVDLIHTSTWTGSFPAWIGKTTTNTPSVMTVHEVFAPIWGYTDRNWLDRTLHKILEKSIYSLSFDRYTTVSKYTKDCLIDQGKDRQKIDVVYNGIDHELFDPDRVDKGWMKRELGLKDKFVYTYYGRPGFSKGVEYLVNAVPLIKERVPDSCLLLILGHKPEDRYQRVLELISDLGLDEHVRILDPVERGVLPQYVGGSDCVVVPSISEGFGFTAAEACELGVPVVATTAGSLPEVVSGRYELVEPRDPDAIAEAVIDVYNGDYDEKPKKKFRWDDAINEYIDIYEELV